MAGRDKYEKRPLDGFAACGFSVAYDEDRARAEKELAGTMAGPKDFWPEHPQEESDDTADHAAR